MAEVGSGTLKKDQAAFFTTYRRESTALVSVEDVLGDIEDMMRTHLGQFNFFVFTVFYLLKLTGGQRGHLFSISLFLF